MTPEQELEIYRCYHALFLDESGMITPEGEVILRDLEKVCGWMPKKQPITSTGAIDPLRVVADQEKRIIYAHIKSRLLQPPTQLKRKIEE